MAKQVKVDFRDLVKDQTFVQEIVKEVVGVERVAEITEHAWKRIEKKVQAAITAAQLTSMENVLVENGSVEFPHLYNARTYKMSSFVKDKDGNVTGRNKRKVSVTTRKALSQKYNK